MQFKYDEDKKPTDAIAYIDASGDLVIRTEEEVGECICLNSESEFIVSADYVWQPDEDDARRVFYPGDTLTITF